MFKNLFSIKYEDNSHTTVRIFGIKIRILKAALRKKREEYKKTYSDSDIINLPKADNELREIQLANLGMLKCIDKLCKDNNINYWIDFGTLLGAVRHKGFIPWDDDIDIGMLREDYEKFYSLFQEEIKEFPNLYCYLSCNYRNKCFLKIKHKKSENLFVDIFPYDLYYKKLNTTEKKKLSKNIHNLAQKKWQYFQTEAITQEHIKNITQKKLLGNQNTYKGNKPAIFMALDFPHRHVNKVYDYEQIFPLKKIVFENGEFPCPNKSKEILKSLFKNYMTIPKDVYPRHTDYINLSSEEKEVIKDMGNF